MELRIGEVYSNDAISKGFSVSGQGGIRPRRELYGKREYVVVITSDVDKETKRNPYKDEWDGDDKLRLTGQGLKGDQKLTGNNLILRQQIKDRFPVYVFKKRATDNYVYKGRFDVKHYRTKPQPDILDQSRTVFAFTLIRREDHPPIEPIGSEQQEPDELAGLHSRLQAETVTPVAIDLGGAETQPPGRIETRTLRVVRDTRLTRLMKTLYSNRCQVCGASIHLREGYYSEAHHIRPLGKEHKGVDTAENIIILCPNHHAEFDYGVAAIDPDTLKVVHVHSDNPFNGMRITLEPIHSLKREYLLYHLNNIFRGES